MNLDARQQAELRSVVLEFLVARFPCAYEAPSIAGMLGRRQVLDFAIDADAVETTCVFLKKGGMVDDANEEDPLTPVAAWQASHKGVLHVQRKEVAPDPRGGAHL